MKHDWIKDSRAGKTPAMWSLARMPAMCGMVITTKSQLKPLAQQATLTTATDVQGETLFLMKKESCAGPLEGTFIKMLTQLTGAKTVLEVGMFTGTTTLAVAQALPADGQVKHWAAQ